MGFRFRVSGLGFSVERFGIRAQGSKGRTRGCGSRGKGVGSTKGPMWGYPRCGLGAVGAVLEPFCGHLSPKLDKVY